ncbi:hypothetical protein JMN32_03590 [Fulvivirga sp. 29W222]|uniref:Uncharacterized protein n=1 Tax=Fulvivirga marina TaxID=2494733 RepID=A0A937FTH9_9BACT|nr:hypothetical protein [Fulvivirga marina]MBL6445374.1 hypothetical protein [Fulvivirga marina]
MVENNEFIPFKGTKKISFGMTRHEIRELLDSKYITFLRNEFAENTSDYYEEKGFFIEYNSEDICDAIEFVGGSLIYEGKDLLTLKFEDLNMMFGTLSKKKEIEDDIGVTFYDLGFGATRSGDGSLESLIIFSETYWG